MQGYGLGTTFDRRGPRMERDQLIDLTRRACKLARDNTTDLAAQPHRVDASEYTSAERHERDRAMVLASPQLVGYASELPAVRRPTAPRR